MKYESCTTNEHIDAAGRHIACAHSIIAVSAVVVMCMTSRGQPLIGGMTKHENQPSYQHNSSSDEAHLDRNVSINGVT